MPIDQKKIKKLKQWEQATKDQIDSIPDALDALAKQMIKVATKMEYFGGFSPISQHGREMLGAAKIAKGWAREIRKDRKKRSRNGATVGEITKIL